jgi:hypothetical protein
MKKPVSKIRKDEMSKTTDIKKEILKNMERTRELSKNKKVTPPKAMVKKLKTKKK